jgi:hypothetical protein
LLVDGGVALTVPTGLDVDALLQAVIGPAVRRLSMTFPDTGAYLDFFRAHPALGPDWGPAAEAYVLRDLAGEAPELHSSCALAAVRGDATDMLITGETVQAVHHLECPARLMWAQRGMLNEDQGLYDESRLSTLDPRIAVERVAGVNHYTILLADAGAQRVADRIVELAGAQPSRDEAGGA